MADTGDVFMDDVDEVYLELDRQWDKWGDQLHDDFKWTTILVEEVGEVAQECLMHQDDLLYKELIQVAAVAINHARTVRLRGQAS